MTDIICEKRGHAGCITLNRPKALNALNEGMVLAIAAALNEWSQDDAVRHVVIRGAGEKAFCAGGDIKAIYEGRKAGQTGELLAFWAEEYRLNVAIRAYPKPYVALIDGLVMGGGVGVSLHGSHPLGGDHFQFAMPEVSIGFFPDVGATYLLPRLPHHIGHFLALTGERAGIDDALALGLVHAHVPSARFDELAQALESAENVDAVIAAFAIAPVPLRKGPLLKEAAAIDACFSGDNVGEILRRLDAADSPFCAHIAAIMRKHSPASMAVALRQMQLGRSLDMVSAMRLEYRIVSRLYKSHDFAEGVRARVIDKDQQPKWSPEAVEVEAFFAALPEGDLQI